MAEKLKHSDIACAILAGGKNSRYNGENKALIEINNQKIIDRILDAVSDLFNEIVIVSNNPDDFNNQQQIKIIPDIYLAKGPLGGIHSALSSIKSDSVFVVACDMPFLNKMLISSICEQFETEVSDILIPVVNKQIEPLHAIYSKNILPVLEKFLSSQQDVAIRKIFPFVNTKYLNIDTDIISFSNINTKEDFNNLNKAIDKE